MPNYSNWDFNNLQPDMTFENTNPFYGTNYSTPDFSGIAPYNPGGSKSVAKPGIKSVAKPSDFFNRFAVSIDRMNNQSRLNRAQAHYGTQTQWKSVGTMPTMGELPAYNLPKLDRKRISELTELNMGAGMSKLRRGLNKALIEARYSDNPNVRANALRKILAGYGQGIGDIRASASRRALSEYMPEFQAQVGKSRDEYMAGIQRIRDIFNADVNKYMRSGVLTSIPVRGALNRTGLSNSSTYNPPSGVKLTPYRRQFL